MSRTRLDIGEGKLKEVFDRIDDYLEDKYGKTYPLQPNRPERGETASKAYDGLFGVVAKYSTGYSSELGEGYVVEVRMATLEHVPEELRVKIENEVVELLNNALPEAFPDRELKAERDGQVYKIIGNLDID